MSKNGKDSYWFPHDAGARGDLRITELKMKRGYAGVGIFWCVVEMLREANQDGYRIQCDKIPAIEYELRLDEHDGIFEDLIGDGKLFKTDGEWFWSESLVRRMEPLDLKRKKLSEAGKKGGRPKKKATKKPGLNQAKGKSKPTESNKSRVEESRGEKSTLLSATVDKVWSATPKKGRERSSKKQLTDAMSKIRPRPALELILSALEKQKVTEKWTRKSGEYIEGIHRWIEKRKWEDGDEPEDMGPQPQKLILEKPVYDC